MKELAPMIHDENNGLDYVLCGDYYIPALKVEPQKKHYIGRWGQLHKSYIKQYKPFLYNELVLSCKLQEYLARLNEQANERLTVIMEQMQRAESVTEQLKASNPMEWVRQMNSIRSRAEEIILNELVYC